MFRTYEKISHILKDLSLLTNNCINHIISFAQYYSFRSKIRLSNLRFEKYLMKRYGLHQAGEYSLESMLHFCFPSSLFPNIRIGKTIFLSQSARILDSSERMTNR